jgi:NADP-dependent 3-hydroxy acid dehydrogenase YdfG
VSEATTGAAASMARWKGKLAVVTGASAGIGAAIARRLVQEGMRVVACARRKERLTALHDALGDALIPQVLDVRDAERLASTLREIADREGGVDVLVNNAGLGHRAPLMSGETEAWREMLEVNVLALCVATREVVSDLKARGREGHILHISSMAAHRVPAGSGVYSATKYAVRSLTEGLRQELWEADLPIRVTSLSPAFVETEFAAKYHQDEGAAERTYGSYRVLQPEDLAASCVYALSQPLEVQVHDLLLRPRRQQS